MALVMTERKVVLLDNGKEKMVLKVGDAVPKEYVAAFTGKPFVKDDGKK